MGLIRRILLVEDTPHDSVAIRRFLARADRFIYRVDEVSTGAAALERCRHESFDLVLLDQHLPDLSGLEVLRQLRALPGWSTAVVALTSESRIELAHRALEAGATDFLCKDDLTAPLLCRAVDNALTKEQLLDALRRSSRQTSLLQEMTAALSGATTPEDVVHIALREGVHAIGAQAGFVSLLSEDGQFLRMHPRVGFREDAVQGWQKIPLATPLPITEAVRTGEVVVCTSMAERDARYPALAKATRYHEAIAAIPFTTPQGVIGAMGVSFLRPREFSSADLELLRLVGRLCSQALLRSRAQAKAESQQALLDAVLRHMPAGVIVVEPSGKVLLCNEQLKQMVSGASPLPLEESPAAAQDECPLTPENWPLARAALRGESISGQEVPLRWSDGTTRTIRVFSSPVYGPDQRLIAGVTLTEDVTEEKLAQQRLRSSEERFRTMANAVPSILFERHEETLAWVSGSWSAYTGQSLEESVGQRWLEAIHPEDKTQAVASWQHAIKTRSVYEGRKRLRRADGSYRWFVVRAVPQTSSVDGVTRWLGSCTDIDETIRAEADARKRALFGQQLLGIVSHDLKSPLNAILMSAGLLERTQSQDERVQKAVARINASVARCNRMICDLLDFTQARLGSGIPLHPAPCDLREVVSRALEEVMVAYPHRRVSLEATGELKGVWDGERLTQVATNLLTNALKYSPASGAVSARLKEERGELVFEVHNWGPGIDPALMPVLFEPLQQGAVGKEATGRSVGLGLYIVRELTRAHGGRVEVSSSEAQGTLFRVTLPHQKA